MYPTLLLSCQWTAQDADRLDLQGFPGFCDVIDLLGTSRDGRNQARVGIEPA